MLLSSILHYDYNVIEYVLNGPTFQGKEYNWLISEYQLLWEGNDGRFEPR